VRASSSSQCSDVSAGTTALWDHLNQHSNVKKPDKRTVASVDFPTYHSDKEFHFFDCPACYARGIQTYERLLASQEENPAYHV
jgi:hypothetical protein